MTTVELYKSAPGGWCRKVDFPTKWNEMTDGELRMISHILAIDGSRQELLLKLLAGRAKMQGKKLPAGWEVMLSREDATIQGLALIDGLLAENNLTRNPLPMIAGYYGPADAFDDLNVGEFEEAEPYFLLYAKEKKEEHLAQIAAILWRPVVKKRKLHERVKFTGYKPDKESFSTHLNVINLHLIWLWYTGCRSEMMKLFPAVFEGDGGDNREPDPMAFTRVVHNAAGVKNGTRAQVRATLIKELLFECQLAAEQAIEMEAALKK